MGSVADAELVLPGGASDAELIGKVPSRSIVLAESAVRCLILLLLRLFCLLIYSFVCSILLLLLRTKVNGVLSAIATRRALDADDFKRNHPGGAIGRSS